MFSATRSRVDVAYKNCTDVSNESSNITQKKDAVGYYKTLVHIQGVTGGKVNILGGYSIGHSTQKPLYEHVSYSERFPRYSHLTV